MLSPRSQEPPKALAKTKGASTAKAGRWELRKRETIGPWGPTPLGSLKNLRGHMGIHELRSAGVQNGRNFVSHGVATTVGAFMIFPSSEHIASQ